MKISVIIPTKDRKSVIESVESIFLQEHLPNEIIIIDDGSIIPVKTFLEKESHFNFNLTNVNTYRFENSQGVKKARNKGMQIASGDILMFLDDDDTWEPKKVGNQVTLLTERPEIGLVYTGRLMVNSCNRKKVLYKVPAQASGKLYPKMLYRNIIGTISSVAIKKSLLSEVGYFDEKLPAWEDYDFLIRCCKSTTVDHDDSYNVRYTLPEKSHESSYQSNRGDRRKKAYKILINKYQSDIEAEGLWGSRKIKSEKLFSVGRGMREQGVKETIPWILKSFFMYPNLKALSLMFPIDILGYLKNILKK